jgi:pimeloyl-ACP methyl ester carboxylesterase
VIEVPETRYAKSGDVNIAYQVVGDGPFDLVHVPPFVSNLELQWEDPAERRYFERLASFSRLIMFDKRGTGLSDRVAVATLEERMDDLRAVMDAAGSERAAIYVVPRAVPCRSCSRRRTPIACRHSSCTGPIPA